MALLVLLVVAVAAAALLRGRRLRAYADPPKRTKRQWRRAYARKRARNRLRPRRGEFRPLIY